MGVATATLQGETELVATGFPLSRQERLVWCRNPVLLSRQGRLARRCRDRVRAQCATTECPGHGPNMHSAHDCLRSVRSAYIEPSYDSALCCALFWVTVHGHCFKKKVQK